MEWVYRARVVRVLEWNTVDLSLDLGFRLKYRQIVKMPLFVSPDHWEKAKECLIVLIGGHRILASVTQIYPVTLANLYLKYSLPIEGVSGVILDKKLPLVSALVDSCAKFHYNSATLKENLKRFHY